MLKFTVLALLLTVSAQFACAEEATSKPAAKADNYPLKTCVVSNEAFGGDMGDPVVIDYKGRTVKFCCKDCVKKFNKDPEKYLKVLDDAELKAKAAK